MWCRVLLVVIAVACTFQREIIAEPDDVLCVIYLSGLQKEDLNDDLLKKLQRHNVNIDNLNNEKTIEKCLRSSSSKNNNQNASPNKKILTTTRDLPEQTSTRAEKEKYKIADSKTFQVIDNNKTLIKAEEKKTDKDSLRNSIEYLVNLWTTSKTNKAQLNADSYVKKSKIDSTMLPTISLKPTEINFQTKDVDLINHIFRRYMSAIQVLTTSAKPTTADKHSDSTFQQIKDFLENNYKNNALITKENTNAYTAYKTNNEESLILQNDSITNNIGKKNLFIMSDALQCISKDEERLNSTRIDGSQNSPDVVIPVILNKDTKPNSHSTDMEYINKIFECYIATNIKVTTTLKPTASQKDIAKETILEQIKVLLAKKDNYKNAFVNHIPHPYNNENTNANKPTYTNDEESLRRKSDSILDELLKQKYQYAPLKANSDDEPYTQTVQSRGFINDIRNISVPIEMKNETKIDVQPIDTAYFKKLFQCYIAAKLGITTALKPTTSQNDVSLSQAQEIGFLDNGNNYYKKAFVKQLFNSIFEKGNTGVNKPHDDVNNKENVIYRNDSILNKNSLDMFDPLKISSDKGDQKSRILQTQNNFNAQMPIMLDNGTKIDPQSTNLEYIGKLFKCNIAAKHELTTQNPTVTNQHNINMISQEIKDFLNNKNFNFNKALANQMSSINGNAYIQKSHDFDNIESPTRRKNLTKYINELHESNDQSNMYGALKSKVENETLQSSRNVDIRNYLPIRKFSKRTNIESQSKDLNFIYKIFERFLANEHERTTTQTATQKNSESEVVSQQIKLFLENNNFKENKALVKELKKSRPDKSQNAKVVQYSNIDYNPWAFLKNDSINYLNEFFRQGKQKDLDSGSIETDHLNNVQTIQINKSQKNKVDDIKADIKPLPDNIIKELTKKVKASVMEDLQKRISTTLDLPISTTTKNITMIPFNTPETKQDNIYDATTGLDKFMELFEQLKNERSIGNITEKVLANTLVQIDQDKIKAATRALENFNQLYQQFKKNKENIAVPADTKYLFTQKKSTNNEFNGPINVLYPSLYPVHYAIDAKTQTVTGVPIFVNTYKALQVNNHMFHKTFATIERKKEKFEPQEPFENLSNFNLSPFNNVANKMFERPVVQSAAIIQTDAVEVPLLGIPVPNSVQSINQNIIVTTIHPMKQYKEEHKYRSFTKEQTPRHHKYIGNDEVQFTSDMERKYTDLERQSDSNMEPTRYRINSKGPSNNHMATKYHSDFNKQSDVDMERKYRSDMERTHGQEVTFSRYGRHSKPHQSKSLNRVQKSRDKQFSMLPANSFYREYLSNSKAQNGKTLNRPILSNDRQKERFHEMLEKPYQIQRHSGEYQRLPKGNNRLKVVSRQQLPLNKVKKTKHDDVHFKNFLKSQQRVNDMLEKMLEPKLRVRSVETPDTLHTFK